VFKRLFWLVVGFGMSFWFMRFIRETMERYSPERVSSDLGSALRQLGDDLLAAVAEGRQGMREHEEQLREKLKPGAEL
jgi:hypothetical protein